MLDAARIKQSRSNIVAALAARGKSSFEVSVALGKNRTYIDDYIKGRKSSISGYFSHSLAEYLEIHRSYVEGQRPLTTDINDAVPARGIQALNFNLENTINELDQQIREAEKGSFGIFGNKVDLERIAELKAFRERMTDHKLKSKRASELLSKYETTVHQDAEVGWGISYQFATKVLSADPKDLIVIALEDNSMRPISGDGFSHGERLIIDTRRMDFRRGGPFAIRNEGVVLIRLIEQAMGAAEVKFFGRPLNTHFPTIDLGPTPEGEIIGRVVGQVRPL